MYSVGQQSVQFVAPAIAALAATLRNAGGGDAMGCWDDDVEESAHVPGGDGESAVVRAG